MSILEDYTEATPQSRYKEAESKSPLSLIAFFTELSPIITYFQSLNETTEYYCTKCLLYVLRHVRTCKNENNRIIIFYSTHSLVYMDTCATTTQYIIAQYSRSTLLRSTHTLPHCSVPTQRVIAQIPTQIYLSRSTNI